MLWNFLFLWYMQRQSWDMVTIYTIQWNLYSIQWKIYNTDNGGFPILFNAVLV